MRAEFIHPQDIIKDWKKELRAQAAALRQCAWASSGPKAARAVADSGLALISALEFPPEIGGYFPLRHELDPLPLLEALHYEDFRLSLPRMEETKALTFREWRPGAALERGKFGVREPKVSHPVVSPSILLVPLLAFDRKGSRLGYGAGYYDASLRRLRSLRPIFAIGVAFDEQEFPEVPQEPQDQPLDMILTPSRAIACGE